MQKGIIKNVNKLTGEAIDAKDLASMLSGIIGNESGVLTVFDELRLEKISDNKVRLHSGVYSLKGHILYIPKGSYEDFTIDSGTLGANRMDLLVAEYVKNGEGHGEDILRFRVVKGSSKSGSPQPPNLNQQDINENGITRQEVLYELNFSGTELTPHPKHSKLFTLHHMQMKSRNWITSSSTETDIDIYPSRKGETDAGGYVTLGIPYTKNSIVIPQLIEVNGNKIVSDYTLTSFFDGVEYRHVLWNKGDRVRRTNFIANIAVIR